MKYIILKIIDNKTGTDDEKNARRIGREITKVHDIVEGCPISFQYNNGLYLNMSRVVSLVDEGSQVILKTCNSTYTLGKVIEGEVDES